MKGKISKRLELVLSDKSARHQLRSHLIEGSSGRVKVGSQAFTVRTDVRKTLKNDTHSRTQPTNR